MKKQFTFSIDISKPYFWIIIALAVYIIFSRTSENSQNKRIEKQEALKSDSIKVLQKELKAIRSHNLTLETALNQTKTDYKTIIIQKDAKKNTIDSYDHSQLSTFFTNRYDKSRNPR